MFSAVLRISGDHLDTDGVRASLPVFPCRIDRAGVAGARTNCVVYDVLPDGSEAAQRTQHVEGWLRQNRDTLKLVSSRADVEGYELDIMIESGSEHAMTSTVLGANLIAILADCGAALVITCVAVAD